MMEICPEVFQLDQIAEEFKVDWVCVTWQNAKKEWVYMTNDSEELGSDQLKGSTLFKLLSRKPDSLHIVDDAQASKSFSSDPLVLGPPWIRFYAESSIYVQGFLLGSLCFASRRPKDNAAQNFHFPLERAEEIGCMLMMGGVICNIPTDDTDFVSDRSIEPDPICRALTMSELGSSPMNADTNLMLGSFCDSGLPASSGSAVSSTLGTIAEFGKLDFHVSTMNSLGDIARGSSTMNSLASLSLGRLTDLHEVIEAEGSLSDAENGLQKILGR